MSFILTCVGHSNIGWNRDSIMQEPVYGYAVLTALKNCVNSFTRQYVSHKAPPAGEPKFRVTH